MVGANKKAVLDNIEKKLNVIYNMEDAPVHKTLSKIKKYIGDEIKKMQKNKSGVIFAKIGKPTQYKHLESSSYTSNPYRNKSFVK